MILDNFNEKQIPLSEVFFRTLTYSVRDKNIKTRKTLSLTNNVEIENKSALILEIKQNYEVPF